jgi:hypothetical protein
MGMVGHRHAPAALTREREAGWVPEPVWTGAENLAPTGVCSPDLPARSKSLYRLSYPGSPVVGKLEHYLKTQKKPRL